MTEESIQLESAEKNCWERFSSEDDRKAMESLATAYIDFLSRCKTERETVDYVLEAVGKAGFADTPDADRFFSVMRGKSVFLARKGNKPLSEGIRLLGAHGDTPRLDLKQHPLFEGVNLGLAKTHYYGGIKKYHWPARPLAMHGVAVKKDGEVVRIVIGEDPSDPVFTINDLLPHLSQKQREQKLADAIEAEKLDVILTHEPVEKDEEQKDVKRYKRQILSLLNEKYGLVEDDLYSAEIHMVPAGPARYVGLDKAIIGGYGHDDRACVFASLQAFLAAEDPEHTQVVVFWDKEEIGSEGNTGAKSRFFEYCIEDLIDAWEPKARFSKVMLNTKAISADVHVSIDPNYQDMHEKLNSALIGQGPTFSKFTGHGGKYSANDAHPEYVAWLRNLLDEKDLPWQLAAFGKVDLGGGGTVAKDLAVYGMDIIDCGPPVLSMHSPFELLSKADLYATKEVFKAFLES